MTASEPHPLSRTAPLSWQRPARRLAVTRFHRDRWWLPRQRVAPRPAPRVRWGELPARAFRPAALGRGWRQRLKPRALWPAAEKEVAVELGCAAETAAELRAVCRISTNLPPFILNASFIMIEDTWSAEILAESLDRGYGNLQSVKMEDYTFNDLSLKIGFLCLFCHQGNCEHIVVITDVRLIHRDCLDRNLHPLLIKRH
ncbi:snRNA-activating protein complex subunit 3 [Numida meleagris]|uniref:snRNA-activating protein complex subunit 3 n=1 Tax=Numida meleagris TaxID=8996 RepID=UPI000B3E0884|nr:snRNA-activating protein complex subunit 3 [Numida meleagris]XP_021235271.1 snRNA-activating protein complex subunit 3 [Numida meleagris]XP_021235272.1 snRNA-activating protein complex subunit 3 [Numida meleagris]XP_021235274.1 snRNA-activating protein complex subunit 3 [Numida meleagris]XP_021235275.1 snRNA-activating protein complex subunit 3 [Numida meleagris]